MSVSATKKIIKAAPAGRKVYEERTMSLSDSHPFWKQFPFLKTGVVTNGYFEVSGYKIEAMAMAMGKPKMPFDLGSLLCCVQTHDVLVPRVPPFRVDA